MKRIIFLDKQTVSRTFCSASCDLFFENNELIFVDYLSFNSITVSGKKHFLDIIYRSLTSCGIEKKSLISLLSMAGVDGVDTFNELTKRGLIY